MLKMKSRSFPKRTPNINVYLGSSSTFFSEQKMSISIVFMRDFFHEFRCEKLTFLAEALDVFRLFAETNLVGQIVDKHAICSLLINSLTWPYL